jgi:hypothetical protein
MARAVKSASKRASSSGKAAKATKRPTARAAAKPAAAPRRGVKTPVSQKPVAKKTAAVSRTAAPAPRLSKDELQARVAKLERANITLRAKNKQLKQAADEAVTRAEQMEADLGKLTAQSAAAKSAAVKSPAAPKRRPRKAAPAAAATQENGVANESVSPDAAEETPERTPEPVNDAGEAGVEQIDEEQKPV